MTPQSRDPSTAHDLTLRLQRGDADAFAEVFREYYLPLVDFVYRFTRNQDSAHDVVQDVFVQLWNKRDTIDATKTLRAYLFTIARNKAWNVLEHETVVKRHQQAVLSPENDAFYDHTPGPEQLVSADELIRLAEQSVSRLSPRLQEIYDLSRNRGLSPAEIAQVLGVSVQTVYTQLTRITRELYPILQQWIKS